MSEEQESKRGRGRPRKYPAEVAQDGAPLLTVRMQPELLAWVKEQGGPVFVRRVLEREMREHPLP